VFLKQHYVLLKSEGQLINKFNESKFHFLKNISASDIIAVDFHMRFNRKSK